MKSNLLNLGQLIRSWLWELFLPKIGNFILISLQQRFSVWKLQNRQKNVGIGTQDLVTWTLEAWINLE